MENQQEKHRQASTGRYEVTQADLPLHCPPRGVAKWNSHPRVFLQFDNEGHARCPYCSAEYELK